MSIQNVGVSALIAYQGALSATSNNIANATTPGYTRQTALFTSTMSQKFGNNYSGTGVALSSLFRNTNEFANSQVRNTTSMKSQYDAFYSKATQLDQIFSQDGTSLSASFQSFFGAFGAMNSNPSDTAARTVTLKQATLLTSRFNDMQSIIDQSKGDSTRQITQTVSDINTLTTNLSQLNKQLVASPDAPDLLDQQDQILQKLSGYFDVNIMKQSNGMVNVGLSNGNMLVVGTTQNALSVSSAKSDNFGTKLILQGTDVTSGFNSGALKGMIDYETMLEKSNKTIGQIALGMAQKFNAQQNLGVDLNNQLGKNLFTDFNSSSLQQARAISATSNPGTAVLSVGISDVTKLQISDYELTVTDAATNQYALVRKLDNTSIPLTWDASSSSAPATLSVVAGGATDVDGMTITVDDITHLANQDSFILSPTRNAAGHLDVALSDPRGIALASAVRAQSASANTGRGAIALGTVFNTSSVNNNYDITIDANDPTKYTITGDATVYTLTPGTDNTVYLPPGSNSGNASYSVILSGTPAQGDVFNLGFNSGSVGDNGNGLLMSALQLQGIFSGGTVSLTNQYAALVADIGAETSDAQFRQDSSNVLFKQAVSLQSSTSGVNLDEEAANLLLFQNAYKAAAQVVKTSNDLFDTLFSVI